MIRMWKLFFIVWALLITGLFHAWTKTPGIKQWFELRSLLAERRSLIEHTEKSSNALKDIEHQLETNPVAQEREIRRVLGFVDQNEIVFEFTR